MALAAGTRLGAYEMLFAAAYAGWAGRAGARNYDLSPGGKRFLVVKRSPTEGSGYNIIVVESFVEELKRLAPRAR